MMHTAIETLHRYLICDPIGGKLYWKARGIPNVDSRLAGKEAGYVRDDGYVQVRVDGKLWYRHRLIWTMYHGVEPKELDHVNGIPGDDRIENLRKVTHDDNQRNMKLPKNNTSGRVGVCRSRRGYWQAGIWNKNKRIGLGTDFRTFEEACVAREAAEIKYGYHKNHGRKEVAR